MLRAVAALLALLAVTDVHGVDLPKKVRGGTFDCVKQCRKLMEPPAEDAAKPRYDPDRSWLRERCRQCGFEMKEYNKERYKVGEEIVKAETVKIMDEPASIPEGVTPAKTVHYKSPAVEVDPMQYADYPPAMAGNDDELPAKVPFVPTPWTDDTVGCENSSAAVEGPSPQAHVSDRTPKLPDPKSTEQLRRLPPAFQKGEQLNEVVGAFHREHTPANMKTLAPVVQNPNTGHLSTQFPTGPPEPVMQTAIMDPIDAPRPIVGEIVTTDLPPTFHAPLKGAERAVAKCKLAKDCVTCIEAGEGLCGWWGGMETPPSMSAELGQCVVIANHNFDTEDGPRIVTAAGSCALPLTPNLVPSFRPVTMRTEVHPDLEYNHTSPPDYPASKPPAKPYLSLVAQQEGAVVAAARPAGKAAKPKTPKQKEVAEILARAYGGDFGDDAAAPEAAESGGTGGPVASGGPAVAAVDGTMDQQEGADDAPGVPSGEPLPDGGVGLEPVLKVFNPSDIAALFAARTTALSKRAADAEAAAIAAVPPPPPIRVEPPALTATPTPTPTPTPEGWKEGFPEPLVADPPCDELAAPGTLPMEEPGVAAAAAAAAAAIEHPHRVMSSQAPSTSPETDVLRTIKVPVMDGSDPTTSLRAVAGEWRPALNDGPQLVDMRDTMDQDKWQTFAIVPDDSRRSWNAIMHRDATDAELNNLVGAAADIAGRRLSDGDSVVPSFDPTTPGPAEAGNTDAKTTGTIKPAPKGKYMAVDPRITYKATGGRRDEASDFTGDVHPDVAFALMNVSPDQIKLAGQQLAVALKVAKSKVAQKVPQAAAKSATAAAVARANKRPLGGATVGAPSAAEQAAGESEVGSGAADDGAAPKPASEAAGGSTAGEEVRYSPGRKEALWGRKRHLMEQSGDVMAARPASPAEGQVVEGEAEADAEAEAEAEAEEATAAAVVRNAMGSTEEATEMADTAPPGMPRQAAKPVPKVAKRPLADSADDVGATPESALEALAAASTQATEGAPMDPNPSKFTWAKWVEKERAKAEQEAAAGPTEEARLPEPEPEPEASAPQPGEPEPPAQQGEAPAPAPPPPPKRKFGVPFLPPPSPIEDPSGTSAPAQLSPQLTIDMLPKPAPQVMPTERIKEKTHVLAVEADGGVGISAPDGADSGAISAPTEASTTSLRSADGQLQRQPVVVPTRNSAMSEEQLMPTTVRFSGPQPTTGLGSAPTSDPTMAGGGQLAGAPAKPFDLAMPCQSRRQTCDSCMASSGCVWCSGLSACVQGDKSGPASHFQCARTGWTASAATCAAPTAAARASLVLTANLTGAISPENVTQLRQAMAEWADVSADAVAASVKQLAGAPPARALAEAAAGFFEATISVVLDEARMVELKGGAAAKLTELLEAYPSVGEVRSVTQTATELVNNVVVAGSKRPGVGAALAGSQPPLVAPVGRAGTKQGGPRIATLASDEIGSTGVTAHGFGTSLPSAAFPGPAMKSQGATDTDVSSQPPRYSALSAPEPMGPVEGVFGGADYKAAVFQAEGMAAADEEPTAKDVDAVGVSHLKREDCEDGLTKTTDGKKVAWVN